MSKRNRTVEEIRKDTYIDRMTVGYLACAAWTAIHTDNEGDIVEEDLRAYEFTKSSKTEARKECERFYAQVSELLEGYEAEQAGHDFWLTRNGHGTGFWDRGLGEIGDKLTKGCESFNEQCVSLERGKLYLC